jgi:hypothetical protein
MWFFEVGSDSGVSPASPSSSSSSSSSSWTTSVTERAWGTEAPVLHLLGAFCSSERLPAMSANLTSASGLHSVFMADVVAASAATLDVRGGGGGIASECVLRGGTGSRGNLYFPAYAIHHNTRMTD